MIMAELFIVGRDFLSAVRCFQAKGKYYSSKTKALELNQLFYKIINNSINRVIYANYKKQTLVQD